MAITKKQIIKTAVLPGILPRVNRLFGSGFDHLAYLIAVVYNTVRILPRNHPFLERKNFGTFGIRQVITEASNHIQFKTKNIDQIIIFFSVIAALFILLIQFLLLIMAMIVTKANAMAIPATIPEFFVTPNPREDIAYRLLDLVFGIPDFFGSKEVVGTNLHQALHALFEFYSYAMILVGIIIILYFVVAIVAETATSGTPFGQRYNKAWAPVRLILFFALLIPLTHGLNGGQYITLTAAKLGSGLASTGWLRFNEVIENANEVLTGRTEQNIATPNPKSLTHVPAFILVAKTCQIGYDINYGAGFYDPRWDPEQPETGVKAWAVYEQLPSNGGGYESVLMTETTFQDIAALSGGPDIHIVFGVKDPEAYPNENGHVNPACGSMTLKITDLSEPGSAVIHTAYFELVRDLWLGQNQLEEYATNYTRRNVNISGYTDPQAPKPPLTYKQEWMEDLRQRSLAAIEDAVQTQIDDGEWQMSQRIRDYGWGGAGIWYNRIAQQNGALVTALQLTPATALYPDVMERAKKRKLTEDNEPNYADRFSLDLSANAPTFPVKLPGEIGIYNSVMEAFEYWEGAESNTETRLTGNVFIDTINAILGTEGLFEICENTDIHPLAQLSTVGKSMVDRSIGAFAAAGIFTVGSIIPNPLSGAAGSFASFFGTVGSVGLLIGFILFYVLPFMPFLYFFFAVGGWVKGIFEAMVAMPLWALAHLRIDGDGIPGEAAIGGYYLIFEIFIRPILIVFGLLAAITIFAAMVKVLNEIFYLAISNLSGHDPASNTACFQTPPTTVNLSGAGPDEVISNIRDANAIELRQAFRGPIDEFFFTILYTIVVYMIGTASFKLIDMIPNDILRWINAEVPSFNDNAGDAAEGLLKYVTLGGSQFGSQIGESIGGMGKGLQGTAQSLLSK